MTSNDHVEGIPIIFIHGIQANKGSVMTMQKTFPIQISLFCCCCYFIVFVIFMFVLWMVRHVMMHADNIFCILSCFPHVTVAAVVLPVSCLPVCT